MRPGRGSTPARQRRLTAAARPAGAAAPHLLLIHVHPPPAGRRVPRARLPRGAASPAPPAPWPPLRFSRSPALSPCLRHGLGPGDRAGLEYIGERNRERYREPRGIYNRGDRAARAENCAAVHDRTEYGGLHAPERRAESVNESRLGECSARGDPRGTAPEIPGTLLAVLDNPADPFGNNPGHAAGNRTFSAPSPISHSMRTRTTGSC